MKNSLLLLSMIISMCVSAQDQFEIRAYSTAALGSNLAVKDADFRNGDRGFKTGVGLNGGIEFFVVDGISVNLGYTKYFKSSGNQIIFGTGSRNYFYEASYINLNGKYYIDSGLDWIQTYGLFGLTSFTSDYRVQGENARPITKNTGVNIGAGAVFLTQDFWHVLVE